MAPNNVSTKLDAEMTSYKRLDKIVSPATMGDVRIQIVHSVTRPDWAILFVGRLNKLNYGVIDQHENSTGTIYVSV